MSQNAQGEIAERVDKVRSQLDVLKYSGRIPHSSVWGAVLHLEEILEDFGYRAS